MRWANPEALPDLAAMALWGLVELVNYNQLHNCRSAKFVLD